MKVMSFKAILALGVLALTPFAALAGSPNGHYSVELNKTEVVYLPANAGAVVIGNPEIADVSVHSANTIFVVGRGYGETNLVVLNAAGHKIMDADIQVVNNLPSHGGSSTAINNNVASGTPSTFGGSGLQPSSLSGGNQPPSLSSSPSSATTFTPGS